jgi:uncharacterized protein YcbX
MGQGRTSRAACFAEQPADLEEELMASTPVTEGFVTGLWRYPVKSMGGEELDASQVTERGLVGDRAYALIDAETKKVVSAKNPRKWPNMFEFRATLINSPQPPGSLPPARITFPEGTSATTNDPGIEHLLSERIGRPVQLASRAPEAPQIEGYWPDYDWLEKPDEVFEVALPPGTFFDVAVVHIITTATLARLGLLAPQSRFDVDRFRPNVLIEAAGNAEGFVENAWVGRTLGIGSEVRLRITQRCARCVMTTLSQGDLPKDPNVLRTIVQHNQGNAGVLAAVIHGGTIGRGDSIVVA